VYKTSNAINFKFGAHVSIANFFNISACKKKNLSGAPGGCLRLPVYGRLSLVIIDIGQMPFSEILSFKSA